MDVFSGIHTHVFSFLLKKKVDALLPILEVILMMLLRSLTIQLSTYSDVSRYVTNCYKCANQRFIGC